MQKVKEKNNWKGETIVEIEVERLKAFRNHPFQVRDDDDLEKLKESIKMYGILTPLLVRPIKDGTYEIISGHRRKRTAALLGYRKIPVLIQPMSYEDAVVKMVDTNLHREHISFSEKAFAYRMKNEAMNYAQSTPSVSQAQRIKKLSKAGELTKKHMEDILSEIKKGEVTRVEFNNAQLHKFFPYNYSPAMMKREILAILKIYKEQYSEK